MGQVILILLAIRLVSFCEFVLGLLVQAPLTIGLLFCRGFDLALSF